jgi:probable addiction module antidote protein
MCCKALGDNMKTYKFDIAEHLKTTEDVRAYLQEVAATGTDSDYIHALNTASRAMGMTEIAKKA